MEKFGPKCGRMTLALLLTSAGMYHASTAYLPSSFAMYMNMVAMGAWLKGVVELGVVATALSALVGWPFAAILGLVGHLEYQKWRTQSVPQITDVNVPQKV